MPDETEGGNNWTGLAAGIIGGAITGGIGLQNQKNQRKQNQEDRDFQREMYAWSHFDALEDWRRVNDYNHPSQQMQRLREAGLNPNLIYGKGADVTAGMISAPKASGSNQPAPFMSPNFVPAAIDAYNNTRMVQAQVDNLDQNVKVQAQEEILKQAQVAKTLTDNAKGQFDLEQAKQLQDSVVLRAQLENERIDTEIDVLLDRNAREELANSTNVTLTLNKILTEEEQRKKLQLENATTPYQVTKLRAEIEQLQALTDNTKLDGVIKSFDAEMRKQGIDPRDPFYWRLFEQYLKKHIPDFGP